MPELLLEIFSEEIPARMQGRAGDDLARLLGRAGELGRGARDPAARKALVSAVVDSVVADSSDLDPGDEVLRSFYEENLDYFRPSPRLLVEQVFFRSGAQRVDHERRAAQALARLRAGESAAAVVRDLSDPAPLPVPAQALPPAKLRDYVGPTAARTAMGLAEGEYSEVLATPGGARLIRLLRREQPDEPENGQPDEPVNEQPIQPMTAGDKDDCEGFEAKDEDDYEGNTATGDNDGRVGDETTCDVM